MYHSKRFQIFAINLLKGTYDVNTKYTKLFLTQDDSDHVTMGCHDTKKKK